VAWNGGKWVAGGRGSNPLAYSFDGMTWYQSVNGNLMFTQCNGLTWNGSYWIATGQGAYTLAYSQDGITWFSINNSLYSNNVGKAICSRRVIPNTGLALTGVAGSSSIDTVSLPTLNLTLGYNQTWQNMTAQRALNVTYTNTTGRPIMIYINMIVGGLGIFLYINNLNFGDTFTSANTWIGGVAYLIIPDLSTYRVFNNDSGNILQYWYELR
jgi:hypothetical protein